MRRLEDLEAFIAIVELGSLTAAARFTQRTVQAVSRSLALLEADVGLSLIRRTTRQCIPTEAGMQFYDRIKPALAEISTAKAELMEQRIEPSGMLRVSASVLFGPQFLVPIIAEYMHAYPNVEIDLQLSDAFVDIAEERLDMAIRIGDLPDSGLRARKLGTLRRVVFGSPAYFARHGVPMQPSDLRHHSCIVRTVHGNPAHWSFLVHGKPRTIAIQGRFRTNTMAAIYAAVQDGLGLGYSPVCPIRHLVDSGAVQIVLQEYEPAPVPIHVLWHGPQTPPAKVRTFIDFVVERLDLGGL